MRDSGGVLRCVPHLDRGGRRVSKPITDELRKWVDKYLYPYSADYIQRSYGTALIEFADQIDAEHEKLKELCTDLFNRLRDEDEQCGECRSSCEYDAWNFGDPKCVYAMRMRELGIEVR